MNDELWIKFLKLSKTINDGKISNCDEPKISESQRQRRKLFKRIQNRINNFGHKRGSKEEIAELIRLTVKDLNKLQKTQLHERKASQHQRTRARSQEAA